MTAYFIRRFLLIVPTFLGVTMIVFMITRIVPGGPLERKLMELRRAQTQGAGTAIVEGGDAIPESAIRELKKQFHLDKPGPVAYFLWLKDVAMLNLGDSYYYKKPVLDMVVERFPVSLIFGLTGFLLSYLVCVPLGIFKAIKHGSAFDYVSSAIVFIGYSIPGWALGILLLLFLASGRFYDVAPLGGIRSTTYDSLPAPAKWIDAREYVVDEFGILHWDELSWTSKLVDRFYYMFLPVVCYMVGGFATLTILMKNSLLENLGQDYVRTAFAKGLSERRVVFLHVLRNSLIPIVTGLGHALGLIMAGSYLIEFVFNIDGLGYLGYNALVQRDYAIVLGVLVINTLLLLLGNIFSDILYALIDPRIRFE